MLILFDTWEARNRPRAVGIVIDSYCSDACCIQARAKFNESHARDQKVPSQERVPETAAPERLAKVL